jgi:hypothetical protein
MNRLLALFMFLLLSTTAFAQQPASTTESFDDRAAAPQGASLVSFSVPDGSSKGWSYNGAPDLGFLQDPLKGRARFLAVSSDSPRLLPGFQAVISTTRSTPTAFGVAAAGNLGGTWNFAYRANGTAAAATHDDCPYQLKTGTLFANNYNDSSTLFLPLHPVYTAPAGNDRYTGTGFNLGNVFKAISARGRLMTSAIHRVGGLAQKTAKLH